MADKDKQLMPLQAQLAMTLAEATDWKRSVGNAVVNLRQLIYEGHEREAWRALGYENWTACIRSLAAEFGLSERRLWQIQAANEIEVLLNQGSVGEIPERQLRELKRLPEAHRAEALQEAVETAPNGKPTAAIVQEVVDQRQARVRQSLEATVYSSESNEYYTPLEYIEAARRVMGGIDLDPASCEAAQAYIKAAQYFTTEDDGLRQKWHGRVWLNPPYGKIGNESSQGYWAQRLLDAHQCGDVEEAILLVKAALGYEWFEKLWDEVPVCFPRRRLSFVLPNGNDDGQSKQGSALFYFGSRVDVFADVFSQFGRVLR